MTRPEAMRAARKARGMTIRQLSDISGYTRAAISQLERGLRQGNIDTIATLAEALDMSIDEYIGYERRQKHG